MVLKAYQLFEVRVNRRKYSASFATWAMTLLVGVDYDNGQQGE